MNIILTILALSLVVAIWVAWARDWLYSKRDIWPWTNKLFQIIEPIELHGWRKSNTLLWARFKMALGMVLTLLTYFQQINFEPIKPFLPEKWRGVLEVMVDLTPMALTIVGFVDEKLRKDTTLPLELVAVSEKEKEEKPEIAQAIETAQTVKAAAVETVVTAKAEG